MSIVQTQDSPENNGQSASHRSPEDQEFVAAVEAYQKRTGRKYPSYSELFGVLTSLGYFRQVKP